MWEAEKELLCPSSGGQEGVSLHILAKLVSPVQADSTFLCNAPWTIVPTLPVTFRWLQCFQVPPLLSDLPENGPDLLHMDSLFSSILELLPVPLLILIPSTLWVPRKDYWPQKYMVSLLPDS